jgi:hypothetical protein
LQVTVTTPKAEVADRYFEVVVLALIAVTSEAAVAVAFVTLLNWVVPFAPEALQVKVVPAMTTVSSAARGVSRTVAGAPNSRVRDAPKPSTTRQLAGRSVRTVTSSPEGALRWRRCSFP